jgi:hypothetical protein
MMEVFVLPFGIACISGGICRENEIIWMKFIYCGLSFTLITFYFADVSTSLESQQGQEIFLFCKMTRLFVALPACYSMGTGSSFSRGKGNGLWSWPLATVFVLYLCSALAWTETTLSFMMSELEDSSRNLFNWQTLALWFCTHLLYTWLQLQGYAKKNYELHGKFFNTNTVKPLLNELLGD